MILGGLPNEECFSEADFPETCDLEKHQEISTVKKYLKKGWETSICTEILRFEECGKYFTFFPYYVQHQRLHSGEKPCPCEEGGRGINNSAGLIRQQRIHSGDRPLHLWTMCGNGFPSSSELVIHQRVHTGEKPYECMECGKVFAVRSTLSRHQSIHRGEKPYECSECGKIFRTCSCITMSMFILERSLSWILVLLTS